MTSVNCCSGCASFLHLQTRLVLGVHVNETVCIIYVIISLALWCLSCVELCYIMCVQKLFLLFNRCQMFLLRVNECCTHRTLWADFSSLFPSIFCCHELDAIQLLSVNYSECSPTLADALFKH